MPERQWTDKELIEAVAESTTLLDVFRRLGLRRGNYEGLRRHIERLGVDATHIRSASGGGLRRSWNDEDLAAVVAVSRSLADVMRRLGYAPSGGVHRWLKAHIVRLGVSTTHFRGQGWSSGRRVRRPARPLAAILVAGSTYPSGLLRRRLILEGLKEARCEVCGLSEWLGHPMQLMLDHINGDHTDNRLENLRILCPNCHALTPTWCARNRKPA